MLDFLVPMTAWKGIGPPHRIGPAEFPVYVALKVAVYRQLLRNGHLPTAPADSAALPLNFSVRQVHRMLSAAKREGRNLDGLYTDFFELTPQCVRERMKNLNHGVVLSEDSRGRRNAVLYRWKEPIVASALASFKILEAELRSRINLALDLYLVHEQWGEQGFTYDQMVSLFQKNRDQVLRRRKYFIMTRASATSPLYTRFLRARVEHLIHFGLLVGSDSGYRLTAKAFELVHWFELFIHSAQWQGA